MTRVRTINAEVSVDLTPVFEGDRTFVVVSVLLDEAYQQDRCTGCGWGAWPEQSELDDGNVQRWGPLTTIGAYTWESRSEALGAVERFMARQGYMTTDPDDYDDEEEMMDSSEYDPAYDEALESLRNGLEGYPANQFTIWDGFGFGIPRAPRFGFHVAVMRFGDRR